MYFDCLASNYAFMEQGCGYAEEFLAFLWR